MLKEERGFDVGAGMAGKKLALLDAAIWGS